MRCEFECVERDGSHDCACRACGRKVRARRLPVRAECGNGLGDRVASTLAAVGITKERVAAVIGDCGCEQRQKWLNEVGHRLGIGTPDAHETGNTPPPPPG